MINSFHMWGHHGNILKKGPDKPVEAIGWVIGDQGGHENNIWLMQSELDQKERRTLQFLICLVLQEM